MVDSTETYSIASPTWPGLAKLLEECGEVIQVLSKLMVAPNLDHTWVQPDGSSRGWGDLTDALHEELGDLHAALDFFIFQNDEIDFYRVQDRTNEKYRLFCEWHREGLLDRTPD